MVRATIESVAENSSDGMIAPLLYLFVGGPAAAMGYKAINTLDSMIGHTDSRYLYFGRWAARMDDFANLIPARLSAAMPDCGRGDFGAAARWMRCGYAAPTRGAIRVPTPAFRRPRWPGRWASSLAEPQSMTARMDTRPLLGVARRPGHSDRHRNRPQDAVGRDADCFCRDGRRTPAAASVMDEIGFDRSHGGALHRGAALIDFSVSTNPFGPPPGVLAAYHRADATLGSYPRALCRHVDRGDRRPSRRCARQRPGRQRIHPAHLSDCPRAASQSGRSS